MLLAAAAICLAACETEEKPAPKPEPKPENTECSAEFSIDRQDAGNVIALLFDNDGALEGVSRFNTAQETYSLKTDSTGNYSVFVVANADEQFAKGLEDLDSTFTVEDLEGYKVDQTPEIPGLFTAKKIYDFTADTSKTASIGTVALEGLVSRIDIANGVEGMTINSVSIDAISLSTTLIPSGQQEYSGQNNEQLSIVGNPSAPETYEAFKSYPVTEVTPKVTIGYTVGEETFSVECEIDNGIEGGSLYTIFITEDPNAQFNHETGDLEDGGIFKVVIETPKGDTQEEMNAALLINRFAKFNVLSMDESNNTVEFATDNSSAENASGYFLWSADWATKTYTNGGKTYRVPTVDELLLLCPKGDVTAAFYKEYELKDQAEVLPTNLFDETNSGGTGTSEFKGIQISDAKPKCIIYAIRFKGTAQYAAYKYEWDGYGTDNDNSRLLIKVKALSEEVATSMEDVITEGFWAEEYIEYVMPACGWQTDKGIYQRGVNGYYFSSTKDENPAYTDDRPYMFDFSSFNAYIHSTTNNGKRSLRLVEVVK